MIKFRFFIGAGLLVVFGPKGLYAQQQNRLEIVVDPIVTALQEYRAGRPSGANVGSDHSTSTTRSAANRSTTRGFRVQVFLGSNRSEAYAEQARFKRLFGNIDTYITYDEPNYRVKVGDFRSRREAEELMQGLKGQFSNVYVFIEDIFIYH